MVTAWFQNPLAEHNRKWDVYVQSLTHARDVHVQQSANLTPFWFVQSCHPVRLWLLMARWLCQRIWQKLHLFTHWELDYHVEWRLCHNTKLSERIQRSNAIKMTITERFTMCCCGLPLDSLSTSIQRHWKPVLYRDYWLTSSIAWCL